MKDYESIFILTPTLDEAECEKYSQRFQDVITANGGEMVKVERWGKRKLAYIVRKQKKGEYILLQFKGQPVTVAELERNYKMADPVIKYMTVRIEKDMMAAKAAKAAAEAEAAARAEAEAAAALSAEGTEGAEGAEGAEAGPEAGESESTE